MNEKKLNIKPNELTTPSSDEAEQEKIINLWEETKPFGELKESLRRHISKRLDIQVKKQESSFLCWFIMANCFV